MFSPARPISRILFAAGSLFAIALALFAQHLLGGRADAAAPAAAGEPTAAAAGKGQPSAAAAGRGIRMVTRKFRMGRPNQKRRLTVRCPGNKWPMGGGVKTNPPLSAGGEGVYPHSYERLGVQGGFHTTPVLWDPTPRHTQRRTVKLQVMCGRKLGKVTPPHRTKWVKPGKTKTVIATCPGRRHLFGGGFQRTNFISRGGNFVTESHAISSKSWQVTAHAFGDFGGEITAIAYCMRSRRPLLRAGLGLDHDRTRPGRHGEDAAVPRQAAPRLRGLQQLAVGVGVLGRRALQARRVVVHLGLQPLRSDRQPDRLRLLPLGLGRPPSALSA